jgi:L1 cell adhesion molecule like protein
VDANGILNVSAAEKSTGKSNNITIKSDNQRSKDDIERMVAEAEKYADEDKAVMERIEARNQTEAFLYRTRGVINEEKFKEKLGEDNHSTVDKLITEGLAWLEDNREATKEEIDAKRKEWEDTVGPMFKEANGGEDTDSAAAAPAADAANGMPDLSKMSEGVPLDIPGVPGGGMSYKPKPTTNFEEVD